MNQDISSKRSPWAFFVLVYALSIPFWVVNVLFPLNLPIDNLPVTDIGATFMPLVAASILVHREGEPGGVRRFLKRVFDYKRITKKIWYIPIFLLMPIVYVITYTIMRLAGLPVPAEWHIPLVLPLLFVAFFFAAAGEELGYTGYAIDPLQSRYPSLTAGIMAGSFWAIWHLPSMIQIGQTPGLIAWGLLGTVGFRILIVWIYNNTGNSVCAAILFHAMTNTGRSVFPGSRSAYELADGIAGYSLIIVTAVIVVFLWGSKTLARFRLPGKRPEGSIPSGE
ncbi:MAG: CPBP family intramembrane metalloprotease [Methanolinea sp.]|nr:CPBP family intramembrane metalloprotease [Methanolinea sp.]